MFTFLKKHPFCLPFSGQFCGTFVVYERHMKHSYAFNKAIETSSSHRNMKSIMDNSTLLCNRMGLFSQGKIRWWGGQGERNCFNTSLEIVHSGAF